MFYFVSQSNFFLLFCFSAGYFSCFLRAFPMPTFFVSTTHIPWIPFILYIPWIPFILFIRCVPFTLDILEISNISYKYISSSLNYSGVIFYHNFLKIINLDHYGHPGVWMNWIYWTYLWRTSIPFRRNSSLSVTYSYHPSVLHSILLIYLCNSTYRKYPTPFHHNPFPGVTFHFLALWSIIERHISSPYITIRSIRYRGLHFILTVVLEPDFAPCADSIDANSAASVSTKDY